MARGFYSPRHLWLQGHRIAGKKAWRIIMPGKYHPQVRHRHPLTERLVSLGSDDRVTVRSRVGRGSNGRFTYTSERYKRKWYLGFLVSLWFANRFDLSNTASMLRGKFQVRSNRRWIWKQMARHIKTHWGEVKVYMKREFDIEIQELLNTQMKITKMAMARGDNPQFLSIAQTSNFNLLKAVLEIEDKPATGKDIKSTGQMILDELRKRNTADPVVDDSIGKEGVSPEPVAVI